MITHPKVAAVVQQFEDEMVEPTARYMSLVTLGAFAVLDEGAVDYLLDIFADYLHIH